MSYMHANDAVHRDLKPENLLFGADGRLMVADFGLGIFTQEYGGAGLRSKCGTPLYTAPEVFLAVDYQGPPVDIWSAGVILYVMLSGSLPFEGTTIVQLAATIMRGRIRFPQGISPNAADLIRKILVVDPKKRPTISEIRAHKWFSEGYPDASGGMTVFEILPRITSVLTRVLCFVVNCGRTEAIQKVMRAAEKIKGQVREDEDEFTTQLSYIRKHHGLVTVKCQLLPIADNAVVVAISLLEGRESGLAKVFKKVKEAMTAAEGRTRSRSRLRLHSPQAVPD
jgi:hypothetical protein